MESSPLAPHIAFHLGPLPIAESVLVTWGIMALLAGLSLLATRVLDGGRGLDETRREGPLMASLEILVEALDRQIAEIMRRDPAPYLPLLGTLFLYLVLANLSAVLPGVRPPTAQIETPAALALLVFLSVHYFGIRARGLAGYLESYAKPNWLLLPLNVLAEFTRTFSLMVRLFGNMMSHEFMIAIVVLLAGLLLPVPFLLLAVLIGLIQAYIFTVLATVYIAAAVGGEEPEDKEKEA